MTLLGKRALLDAGVARQIRRFSGLADKLGGPPPTPATTAEPSPTSPPAPPSKKATQLKLPF